MRRVGRRRAHERTPGAVGVARRFRPQVGQADGRALLSARRRVSGGVEARGQESRAASARSVGTSCCGREEQIGLAGRGRRSHGVSVGATDAAAAGRRSGRGVIRVLVEGRGRCWEASLAVGLVLGQSGAADRAMKQEADDDAPEKDAEAKCAEDGANGDEDGAVRRAGVLHEGRILGGRHGGRWVCRDRAAWAGQRGETSRARVVGGLGGRLSGR